MTISEKLNEQWTTLSDKVKEQEWFQQLQGSYDQLPPEQQQYVKWGTFGGVACVLLYFIYSVLSGSNALKSEYYEKQELLQTINRAGEEIRRLKGQNSGFSQATNQNWKTVLQGIVGNAGLPPDAVEILKETPGPSQTVIQESLLEVQVKGIPVRGLKDMLYQMEHGTPPMKLKGMIVDVSGSDGTLTAKLNLSGYMPKPEKPDKEKSE